MKCKMVETDLFSVVAARDMFLVGLNEDEVRSRQHIACASLPLLELDVAKLQQKWMPKK